MRNAHIKDEMSCDFPVQLCILTIKLQIYMQDYMQLDLCATGSRSQNDGNDARRFLAMTPTIEIVSDCEVEDDVFEQ